MTGSSADRTARTGVVLVNHDSAEDTVGCIASLEASHDLDMDVVVVDNSDSAQSLANLSALVGDRAVVLSSGGNIGYAGGSNVGIRHCLDRGNAFVWLLNPDTRIEPETLPRLLSLMADVPDCGVVGPRIVRRARPRPSGSTAVSSTSSRPARPGTCTRAATSPRWPPPSPATSTT